MSSKETETKSDHEEDVASSEISRYEKNAHDIFVEGRKLNSTDSYSQESFDLLAKAIKLNPYLIEAWVEISECYQKKADIDGAVACLENALKYCKSSETNKKILRNLSTCIRQQPCENQESKVATLIRSLDLSKQALKLDMNDEESYYNLAKAYMCLFFATECVDQQLINLSRATYVKALSLSETRLEAQNQDSKTKADSNLPSKPFLEQSDFLFNFSTVLVYLQEFQKALEYLSIAFRIDPTWHEPKQMEEGLVDYLKQTYSMLDELTKNARRVSRRYNKVIESLGTVDKLENLIQLDQRRLSRNANLKTKTVTLIDLESEKFGTKTVSEDVQLLHLKLLNTINYNQAMYLTFIAIDKDSSLIVVTIYNLAASRCPTAKDVVTIVKPKVELVHVDYKTDERDLSVSYKRIDVREFKDFYVNGQRIAREQVSKPQFKVSVMP